MNKQELLKVLNLPNAFDGFVPVEGTKLWGWNGQITHI